MMYDQKLEVGAGRPVMRLGLTSSILKRRDVTVAVTLTFAAAILVGWKLVPNQYATVSETRGDVPTKELLARMVKGDPSIQPPLESLPQDPLQEVTVRQHIKGPLGNVVFVLSYDKPEQAERMQRLYRVIYEHKFKEIIDIKKQPLPSEATKDNAPQVDDTMSFNYGSLGGVLERDDVEGMIFLSSDTILNHWHVEDADKTKIWFPGLQVKDTSGNLLWAESGQWGSNHWSTDEKWSNQIAKAVGLFPEDAKAVLKDSFAEMENALPTVHTGTTLVAAAGPSHLFYIPARLFPKLKQLSKLMAANFIPAEVAVPTMCLAMEPPESWDHVLESFVQIAEGIEKPSLAAAASLYDVKSAGIRPWPFDQPQSQKTLLRKMGSADSDLATYVRDWDNGLKLHNFIT